jgi:hypothetical protein
MLDRVVPTALEDVDEGDEIGVHVGVRVGEGIAHAGLGGEMDHALGPHPGEEVRNGGAVGEVELLEGEAGAPLELGQAGEFEADVVIVIEDVHAVDLIAAVQEALGEVETDKTGDTGNKSRHGEKAETLK